MGILAFPLGEVESRQHISGSELSHVIHGCASFAILHNNIVNHHLDADTPSVEDFLAHKFMQSFDCLVEDKEHLHHRLRVIHVLRLCFPAFMAHTLSNDVSDFYEFRLNPDLKFRLQHLDSVPLGNRIKLLEVRK